MSTVGNVTTLSDLLRSTYSDPRELLLKLRPFLGLVPKNEGYTGDSYKIPWVYAPPGGGSAQFLSASNNSAPSLTVRPSVDLADTFTMSRINRKLYKVGRKPGAGGKPIWMQESERAIAELGNRWSKWFLNAGGNLGQISDTNNSQTKTLANKQDIHRLERGMILIYASATSGGTIRGGGVTDTVVGVNRRNGTYSGSLYSNANGLTVGDYLFQAGDYNNTCLSFPDYIPTTAPSAGENFKGIDRSGDSRLYGIAVDGTNKGLQESIVETLGECANRGGSPDIVLMNWRTMSQLKNDTATGQWSSVNVKGPVGLSYQAVEFQGPAGTVKVMADPAMPDTSIYVGQLDSWEILSAGPLAELQDDDVPMLRVSGEDTLSWQFSGYGQLICYEPSFNANITISKHLAADGT